MEGTVKIHLHIIFEKLEIPNRTALTAFAIAYERSTDGKIGSEAIACPPDGVPLHRCWNASRRLSGGRWCVLHVEGYGPVLTVPRPYSLRSHTKAICHRVPANGSDKSGRLRPGQSARLTD